MEKLTHKLFDDKKLEDIYKKFKIIKEKKKKSNIYGENSPIGPQSFDHNERFFQPN